MAHSRVFGVVALCFVFGCARPTDAPTTPVDHTQVAHPCAEGCDRLGLCMSEAVVLSRSPLLFDPSAVADDRGYGVVWSQADSHDEPFALGFITITAEGVPRTATGTLTHGEDELLPAISWSKGQFAVAWNYRSGRCVGPDALLA